MCFTSAQTYGGATTTLNTWYDYHVISDGNRIEVWRGPQGGTTELVLETDAATILGSAAIVLETRLCTASFDNVQYITNDPATQTMAYNGANELTSSVVGAITTTYTYDAHGRTISKADGTHSARYIWYAGDKLKQYESDFPGESDVAYNYDALGKRRLKLVNLSAPTDADYTWYRWDSGWNMIGEYAAGSNTGTTWDVGPSLITYTTDIGSTRPVILGAGFPLFSGPIVYFSTDRHRVTRTIFDSAIQRVGSLQITPFGLPFIQTGAMLFRGHSGAQIDFQIGLMYSPLRYYAPGITRWITRDPMGMVDGPNLYQFVEANPLRFIDPTGGKKYPPALNDIPGWVGKCISENESDWDRDAIIRCLNTNPDCDGKCLCIATQVPMDASTYHTCVIGCENRKGEMVSCGAHANQDHEGKGADLLTVALVWLGLLLHTRRRRNTTGDEERA